MEKKVYLSFGLFVILEILLLAFNQIGGALFLFKLAGFLVLLVYFGIRIIKKYVNEINKKTENKNFLGSLLLYLTSNIVFIIISRIFSGIQIIQNGDWYFLIGYLGFFILGISPKFEKKMNLGLIIIFSILSAILIVVSFAYLVQIDINFLIKELKFLFGF